MFCTDVAVLLIVILVLCCYEFLAFSKNLFCIMNEIVTRQNPSEDPTKKTVV